MPSEAAPLPAALDGEGPLWAQIRRALEQPIRAGAWRPGMVIPSEHALMAQFGAARMTVNRAVRSLAEQGLVERRRKRGTVVAAVAPERPVLEIWDVAAESARAGSVYALELLECRVGSAGSAEAGFMPAGTPVLRLMCRHRADGIVAQLEQRTISLAAAPAAATVDFAREPPGPWLLRQVPWTDAEHVIEARPAARDMPGLLEVARGTACLVIERRTWNAATPVTIVRLWHPGDRHRLRGRFQPHAG